MNLLGSTRDFDKNRCKSTSFSIHSHNFGLIFQFFFIFFAPRLDKKRNHPYICSPKQLKKHTMDKLIERIITNDGLNETEAKAKLNLLYIKMNQSGIKSFGDEYIEWLMDEKGLNYKSILQTPDTKLHDLFETEFKH